MFDLGANCLLALDQEMCECMMILEHVSNEPQQDSVLVDVGRIV